ncbi:hypothetical protein [Alteraurantiacibacter aquimixticola]|uniref:Terminase n=1 Tax=Alteraurantiacibacter aquimixticola TaxID=2489173 RepID=A0A4T3F024_9SPHN|nr:hypothetical protein [Alteraurantiacibacter aquimixticola]TIX50264.1 hypothetical protein E5222_08235 [Alteraurantiacibacter aquimixticola]
MSRKPARTLPAFTPVPRKKEQARGWTPERQRAFIEELASCGSVKHAARAVGVSAKSAYDLRRAEGAKGFRKAWEAALDIGIQMIEDVAMDRALNGVEEPVFAYGQVIGTRRVYNDQLLMFMLRNRAPKRFTGDKARSMSGADAFMLKRLKKQWRAEWEREHAMLEAEREDVTVAQLNAKIDAFKQRSLESKRLRLASPAAEPEPDPEPTGPSEEMRKMLPQPRPPEDDGWEWIDPDAEGEE